jgi:mannobiose 2-epimerase
MIRQLSRAAWVALVLFPVHPAAQEAPRKGAEARPFTYVEPNKTSYLKLADETDAMLRRDILSVWFPRTIDNENGGFYSEFSKEWEPTKSLGKFSVFQGRMTWISAQIVMHRADLKEQYLPYVKHGVDYLNDVLWDKQYGGFYWGLDDKGQTNSFYTDGKHLYGTSFGLYGAAAAYQATHDPKALELAKKTFRWIDEHAHDSKHGGYFEWLTREGKVVVGNPDQVTLQGVPLSQFPVGYKSMNTHIHLLESVTQLYEVWKDDTVRRRLEELLAIVRDKVSVQPGAMNLYFTNDWRPIPDHDSYGHDIETAYLMLEAEDVLGRAHHPRTMRMAKQLVDHSLAYGWDENYGGFYGEGITFGKPENKNKEWWVEMEGLNSLLLMHQEYGKQTDIYFKAFQKQWRFIQNYQVDAQYHGFYTLVGEDGTPIHAVKGSIWKGAYHDGRALLNVTDRLHKLAEASPN